MTISYEILASFLAALFLVLSFEPALDFLQRAVGAEQSRLLMIPCILSAYLDLPLWKRVTPRMTLPCLLKISVPWVRYRFGQLLSKDLYLQNFIAKLTMRFAISLSKNLKKSEEDV